MVTVSLLAHFPILRAQCTETGAIERCGLTICTAGRNFTNEPQRELRYAATTPY